MFRLAWASIRARRWTVGLVWLALMASVLLLLTSDRLKTATQEGFNRSINGVDLIISTKTGQLESVLYSVFHVGQPIANIDADNVAELKQNSDIEWAIPIALGDSHGEFRVIATEGEYFDRLKDARNQAMRFAQGAVFEGPTEVVIGAQVASKLDYRVGQSIYLSHGSGTLTKAHDDLAFKIVGILAPTGTPNDQSLFVSLPAYSLLHVGWINGSRILSLDKFDLSVLPPLESVTAVFVGLKNPLKLFRVARAINEDDRNLMSAVIPGVALAQLWSIVDRISSVFDLLGGVIIAVSLLGILAVTLTALDARQREMSILRACGATPFQLSQLVIAEALLISISAAVVAFALANTGSWLLADWLAREFAITSEPRLWLPQEWLLMGAVVASTLLVSLIPAIRVFRLNLKYGLQS